MKKTLILLIIGLVIVGGAYSAMKSDKTPGDPNTPSLTSDDTKKGEQVSVPVTETTKVTSKISEYQNAELGFSLKYPSSWERADGDTSVSFVMPIDQSQVSTVATLKADVNVYASKCAFPPVTTVKERSSVTFGTKTFNMISMENNVQGRSYFNRMYSLQKDNICYMFSFASIAQSAASKGLKGSNLTQAQNNNSAIISTADTAFSEMVKSFEFVTGPKGEDETKAAPVKK